MAHPQRHRKSHSTSALSIIAAATPGPSRISRKGASGGLERVDEGTPRGRSEGVVRTGSRDSVGQASEAIRSERSRSVTGTDGMGSLGIEHVRSWMNEALSLRATGMRRLEILGLLEEALLRCCLGDSACEGVALSDLLALNIHTNLLVLLSRHAQTLSSRAHAHTSLSSTDETATALIPGLTAIFGLLQGLCLLSGDSKKACAEDWAIEMFIDLLLLLRSIPPIPTSSDTPTKPVVYHILELLFCILVDSPANSRVFERLSGLEAVTRVLKGSSVVKEVRMKCIEFLYFYLLPEHQSQNLSSSSASSRSTSGSSTSSSDSLYPPSPLDMRSSFTPSTAPPRSLTGRMTDLDVNFIPQTPRKKVSPNLGYLTPSSRRVSGSSGKETPRLETVPASPVVGEMTPKSGDRRGSAEVGLGLGLPGGKGSVEKVVENEVGGKIGMKRDVTAIHLGALVTSPEPHSAPSRSPRPANITQSPRSPRSQGSGKMSRSSTQPNLAGYEAGQRKSSLSARRMSRSPLVQSSIPESPGHKQDGESSRSTSGESTATASTIQDSHAPRIRHSGTSPALDMALSPVPPVSGPAKIRHSRTSSHLGSEPSPSVPHPPKIRHSRTSSQLSADIEQSGLLEPKSPRIRHSRTASHLSSLAETPKQLDAPTFLDPSSKAEPIPSTPSGGINMERTPSKARRGFPSELTRGLPPPGQTPSKPTPLGHTRRVPSLSASKTSRQASAGKDESGKGGEMKSVQEKKQLLGKWIGNVEALVDGVEGAGWWGKAK